MASKICTTIEQSKRLIELGIDIDTADLTVTNLPLNGGERFDFICCRLPNDTFPSITDGKSEKIPAWSLSALLELLPKYIGDFAKTVNYDDGKYKCGYMDVDGFYDNGFMLTIEQTVGDTAIDAVFEMVVKLKEGGLL